MNRRDFLSLAGLSLAPLAVPAIRALAAGSRAEQRASHPEKPNILWLVSEDNNPFLGCYGDKLAHTPTLDKLAGEGVLFERCFSWPVCAPSRFTIISGMFPVTCGPAEHMRAKGKIPSWLKGFPAYLRQAGYYTSNNSKTDYNSPIDVNEAWNECSKKAHWRNRPGNLQPFFSVFNHEITHESCLFSRTTTYDFERMDPKAVRIPPYQPDTPEMRADWAHYYDNMRVLDGQIASKLKDLAEAGLADDTIVFYYGDNGGVLPRSKRFLQESGVHVPLLVYFPPKWRHLAPAAPGSRIKEPVSFVDFAPTVLSLAGVKLPGYMQGRAFAGPARTEPDAVPVFITRDRMDERYDMMRMVSDGNYIYIRNFRPDLPYVQPLDYMFQAKGYQSWAREAREGRLTAATAMFWGEKPAEELYDMANDPDSVKNLAGNESYRAVRDKLKEALRQRMLDLKDNGLLPEGSELEGYDASRVAGAWPIERVLDLAFLAGDRNAANLPKFVEALDDASEPVRWWGARGCAILGAKAIPAETVLRKHLADPSGAVAVAAAEALARMGKSAEALSTLQQWLLNGANPWFALQAGNVLDHLGELSRPALPAMRQVLARKGDGRGTSAQVDGYINRIVGHCVDVLENRVDELKYPAVKG